MKTNNNQQYMEREAYGIDPQYINQCSGASATSQLFNCAKQVHYEPQQNIFQEGRAADTVFLILKGMVKLISYLPNGNARIVRLLGPGNILGLEAIVDDTYEHSAMAIHDIQMLKIPSTTLRRIKNREPEKFFLLGEQWYEYLRAADTWITQFSTGSITARVARLVTFLAYIETETAPDHVELLKVDEMAAVLGVTPESVSRVLARFKRQQALKRTGTHNEYHYIRDSNLLEEYALDQ
ncbi:MAG: Crp/Fnr family transcriptional regulator [Gammaproteobacteria bacterium]|jgi:CRP-like cAMP-binding protein